ncbi:histidine kinase dimerization/phosphoacceptor domain -containing protein [Mucilaginibacter celer]|uniref:histidine kinase dimerization/phosphoacceptor domain -containing protein n=1 Tax=Mucilaginibacter celer TaxID=2305508 RepID=UPI0013CEB1A1|nr:histidine kinase dimerization/phosphoacceptor domain -containing protein [Mucilaginibacter celer]
MIFKTCLATGILLTIVLTGFAQQLSLQVLKTQLQKSSPDSNRVKILLQTGEFYLSKNQADSAQTYSLSAQNLGTKLGYLQGLGNSYILAAKTFALRKDKKNSYQQAQKAIDHFVTNKLFTNAAEATMALDLLHQQLEGEDFIVKAGYWKKAAALFRQAGAKEREASVLKEQGDFLQLMGRNDESVAVLKNSLAIYQSINYNRLQGIYDLLGNVYGSLGNYKEAIKYGLLAVKTAEAVNDTTMQLCTIYNRLGLTYYFTKQFPLAQLYFEKSLAVAEKYNDYGSIVLLTNNLAVIYLKYNQLEKALKVLKKLEKNHPPQNNDELATLDALLLNVYVLLNRYEEAKVYCDKQLEISKKIDQHSGPQELVQHAIAMFYIKFTQDKPAREHIALFRALSQEHHKLANLAKSYLLTFQLDSTEAKYADAIAAYKKYTTLSDSLLNEKKSQEIAQLEIQYQTEKKDKELKIKEQNIQLLTKQEQLQKANIKQERITRNLIIAGAVLLALLLGLNYNRYRLKQRVNKQLQVQQNEISQKNRSLNNLVNEKDNLLEEKEWLMKEIHHRVKNNLQIVISLLNTQSNYITNDVAFNAIRESQHRMQSISLIHQKLYQSENLALVDMQAYINDLINYLRESFDTGTRIIFETDIVAAEFDVTRAVPLGLILNEAITNSIKYAFKDGGEGKISVSMQISDHDTYVLTVKDDGPGIATDGDITKSKTLGMSLIRGLSKQVGGTFKIETDNGVKVIIEFTADKFIKAI